MKKYLKQIVCVSALAIAGFSFSPTSALAAAWGIGLDSGGNFSAAVGSSSSAICASTGNCSAGGFWALSNPYGLPQGSILGIISNLLFWLLSIFAIFGIIGFVVSGIFYLIAAGDEGMMEKGKEGMKWSIIGIIVGLSGFIIMQAASALLSGSSSNF